MPFCPAVGKLHGQEAAWGSFSKFISIALKVRNYSKMVDEPVKSKDKMLEVKKFHGIERGFVFECVTFDAFLIATFNELL